MGLEERRQVITVYWIVLYHRVRPVLYLYEFRQVPFGLFSGGKGVQITEEIQQ